MAALTATNPTLLDVTKRTDPDGKVSAVAEVLTQTSDILDHMTFVEGNLTTGHRGSIRTGIPEPTWRKYNQGVQPTKSTVATITANTGMLEDYSEVDAALADLAANRNEFRLSEDKAKLQGFNNKAARYLIYGNEGTEPESITGLSAFYNTVSTSVPNSENVIDAGGTGTDNASIWLVVWSPETVFGIYPKGSKAGIQVNDKTPNGPTTINNSDGSRMEAYQTHYKWDLGLFLKDWRFVVRICNIDKSLLKADKSTGANLPDLMYQAMEQVPNLSMGRAVFYMSRGTRSMVRRQIVDGTKNSTLPAEQVGGKMFPLFQEIPMGRIDALAADEARVI